MGISLKISFILFVCCVYTAVSQVIELDDSFDEKKRDLSWIVMFYAPWCGHCRRLHPTFHQVYLELKNHPEIRVAKVDATMYSGLANQYGVRGYPTIKFIHGETSYTHRGERSKENIIEFAKMAHGPQVRILPNRGKLTDAKGDHSDKAFFLYVGPLDDSADLYKKYKLVAEQYPVHAYYYAGERNVLPSEVKIKSDPTVLVFKDGEHYEYEGETKEDLESFVKSERFISFPRVAEGGLNEMADIPKKIVIVVIDEKDENKTHHDRVKDMTKMLIKQHRDKYHKHFQFIWMGDSETASSIVMGRVTVPFVFVLETETQYYYLSETPTENLTLETYAAFLDEVIAGTSPAYGGTGFLQRVKRLVFDIYITIFSIYKESPWLALLVFGVPSLVISIVCYALCCMEPFDEEELYEQLAEDRRLLEEQKAKEEAEKKRLLAGESKEEGEEECQDTDSKDDGHMKKE